MRTVSLGLVFGFTWFIWGSSVWAQSLDRNYLCMTEVGAGISYNPTANKWHGSVLQADKKFVVRLKFERDWGMTKSGRPLQNYTGTITRIGSGEKDVCGKLGSHEPDIITLDDDFTFRCRTLALDYTFNIVTNRFVAVFFPPEYLQEKTANPEAPGIFGGSCTKFD